MTVVLAAPGYPDRPVFGQKISMADSTPDSAVFHAGTREGRQGVEVAGGRVLAVTGWGKDLQAARERAYAAVGGICFTGMHFRRDIGHRALGKTGDSVRVAS
jgi:phosphoribosylamine--glycine ligase